MIWLTNNHALPLATMLALCVLAVGCQPEITPSSPSPNRLYENIYDTQFRGPVETMEYEDIGVTLHFDTERNLTRRVDTKKGWDWTYERQGDTVVNLIAKQQKLLYPLDAEGRATAYISKVRDGGEWQDHYRQDWLYGPNGLLAEKRIQSIKGEKESYFIDKEVHQYGTDSQLTIFKYGYMAAPNGQPKRGLLRTETRTPNLQGDWARLEELDEDGIPYRSTRFDYEYDAKGNWTRLVILEMDNYTNKSNGDTIRRTIQYYE